MTYLQADVRLGTPSEGAPRGVLAQRSFAPEEVLISIPQHLAIPFEGTPEEACVLLLHIKHDARKRRQYRPWLDTLPGPEDFIAWDQLDDASLAMLQCPELVSCLPPSHVACNCVEGSKTLGRLFPLCRHIRVDDRVYVQLTGGCRAGEEAVAGGSVAWQGSKDCWLQRRGAAELAGHLHGRGPLGRQHSPQQVLTCHLLRTQSSVKVCMSAWSEYTTEARLQRKESTGIVRHLLWLRRNWTVGPAPAGGSLSVMKPLMDMVNHERGSPNRMRYTGDAFQLVHEGDGLAAGEEV